MVKQRRHIRDLTGNRYGKLTVISFAYTDADCGNAAMWNCVCDCGEKVIRKGANMTLGRTVSCGCFHRDRKLTGAAATYPSEYKTWHNIQFRCYNEKFIGYHNYGEKGIKVCDRWLESFENFFDDMGPKPTPKHSLDRFPDINGDYSPTNCRWATSKQQNNNTKRTIHVSYDGVTYPFAMFIEIFNLNKEVARYHLTRHGKRAMIDYFIKKGAVPKESFLKNNVATSK